MAKTIGILHPGAMGISVAATAQRSGYEVTWASQGRSDASRKRAADHMLTDVGTLRQMCLSSEIIVSVCPPHAAESVADEVIAAGFQGLYLDANAISPQRARRIGGKIGAAGAVFIDGGIIGGPAWESGRTWLYLSGAEAKAVAECFAAGPLETEVISAESGDASALKMCFAAYTKGTTALLCAILGAADGLGVREPLRRQWSRGGSNFADQTEVRVRQVTAKAWRFAAEMEEIAATFSSANMPDGFHLAAAEIYRRIAHLQDTCEPSLTTVLAALQAGEKANE